MRSNEGTSSHTDRSVKVRAGMLISDDSQSTVVGDEINIVTDGCPVTDRHKVWLTAKRVARRTVDRHVLADVSAFRPKEAHRVSAHLRSVNEVGQNRRYASRHRRSLPTLRSGVISLRWSYCGRTIGPMSSVVKRSVSLPTEIFEALEQQASEEGRSVSAALADAADLWLSTRRGLKSVRAWERQHGALTGSELAEADRVLDAAGVGRE